MRIESEAAVPEPDADLPGGTLHSLPTALLRAREAVMGRFRPSLRAHDVTEQQWRVLKALSACEAIDVSALARESFLLMPSLSRILPNLEARELVCRRAAPEDQRRALISLTAGGRNLLARVAPNSAAAFGEIERCYGRDRMETLFAMLQELELALDMQTTPAGPASESEGQCACG